MFSNPAYFCALFVETLKNINTTVRSLIPTCFLSRTVLSPMIRRNTCTTETSLDDKHTPAEENLRPEVDLFLVHLAHSALILHPCCLITMLCSTNSTLQDPHQADRSTNYLVHAIYRASFLPGIWNFPSVLRFIFFGLHFFLRLLDTGYLDPRLTLFLLFYLLFSYN